MSRYEDRKNLSFCFALISEKSKSRFPRLRSEKQKVVGAPVTPCRFEALQMQVASLRGWCKTTTTWQALDRLRLRHKSQEKDKLEA